MSKLILLLLCIVPSILAETQTDSKPSASTKTESRLNQRAAKADDKDRNSIRGPIPNPERIHGFHAAVDSGRDLNFDTRNRHLTGSHIRDHNLIGNQHLGVNLQGADQHSLFVQPHTSQIPGTVLNHGSPSSTHFSGLGSRFPVNHRGNAGPFLIVPRHRGVHQFGNPIGGVHQFGNPIGVSPTLVYLGNGQYGYLNYNNFGLNSFGQGIYPQTSPGFIVPGGFNRNFGTLGNFGNTGLHHNRRFQPTLHGLHGNSILGHSTLGNNALLNQHSFGDRFIGRPVHSHRGVTDDHQTALHFADESNRV